MVFSSDVVLAVTAGMVDVSDAALANVVLDVAFVILIEDGEDRIAKSPCPKQILTCRVLREILLYWFRRDGKTRNL
jgi:hypothetical protein